MKKSFIKQVTFAGLAALTLSSIGFGSMITAKASQAVATVTSSSVALLYTKDGNLITNRGLAPKTPWLVGDVISTGGVEYYQVATNEYLKSDDASLTGSVGDQGAIGTITNGDAPIYYTITKGDVPAARNLPNGSQWLISSAVKDGNGNIYYEVAPNQWISASNMTPNMQVHTWNNDTPFDGYTNAR